MKRLILLLPLLLLAGCVSRLDHQPKDGLVTELGAGRAVEEFTDLLRDRVRDPKIQRVEVDAKSFTYTVASGGGAPGSGVFGGQTGPQRIPWNLVQRVEVYDTRKAIMFDEGNHAIGHHLEFVTVDDCFRFADFMASFKAHPPGGADEEPAEKPAEEKPAEKEPEKAAGQ
ncbi:MAG: hypothetical protein AB7N76_23125 [Planctomycetota bacterium]